MDKRDKKEMNRREFLKIVGVSTVASTVAMYGCASGEKSNASEASILGEVPVDKMTYRTSPKGEHVSLLGYGCMRWPLKPAPDSDGNVIESVLMRYKHGNSVCYFFSGGMPHGMQILCIYHRRTDQMSSPVRNAGSDIQDTGSDRRKSFQCWWSWERGNLLIIMKIFSGLYIS